MSRIPPELEAEMTPAVNTAYLALLDQVDRLTKQVEALTGQLQKLTPRYPDASRLCGEQLQSNPSGPKRHQVWDLPPIQSVVDEYQLFRGHCPCCGITTQAQLPQGAPTGQCGPSLSAVSGLMMGHFCPSKTSGVDVPL